MPPAASPTGIGCSYRATRVTVLKWNICASYHLWSHITRPCPYGTSRVSVVVIGPNACRNTSPA
eukprot:2935820-Rhodomonas_salina.1